MIQYVIGKNMFDQGHAMVGVTVNLVGVMGAGVAKEAAQRYPYSLVPYQKWCRDEILTFDTPQRMGVAPDRDLLFFATKDHWKDPSQVEWIERGLITLAGHLSEGGQWSDVKDVALPPLGCGHGGLHFERDVQPLIEMYLNDSPATVTVYLPH